MPETFGHEPFEYDGVTWCRRCWTLYKGHRELVPWPCTSALVLGLVPRGEAMSGRWDKDGKPLSWDEWMILYQDFLYRLVRETEFPGGIVRTMWEGLDDGVQVACMWSTGVSRGGTNWFTVWEGYHPCTLAEALEVHDRIVQVLSPKEVTGG